MKALPFLAALALFAACSSSRSDTSEEAPGGADGGADAKATATDGATGDGGGEGGAKDAAGGACNTLVNGAPETTASTVMGAAPAATGGTIVDGTYFQTEFTVYDPAGPASAPAPSGLRVTLAIKGKLMESIQSLPDGSTDTFAETFTVTGTALDRTLSCPRATPDLKAVYSASGKTLTIYETDPSSKLVAGSVYVRQ